MKHYKVTFRTPNGTHAKRVDSYEEASRIYDFYCERFDELKAEGENPYNVTLTCFENGAETGLSHYHG